jgi:hypothetical protein
MKIKPIFLMTMIALNLLPFRWLNSQSGMDMNQFDNILNSRDSKLIVRSSQNIIQDCIQDDSISNCNIDIEYVIAKTTDYLDEITDLDLQIEYFEFLKEKYYLRNQISNIVFDIKLAALYLEKGKKDLALINIRNAHDKKLLPLIGSNLKKEKSRPLISILKDWYKKEGRKKQLDDLMKIEQELESENNVITQENSNSDLQWQMFKKDWKVKTLKRLSSNCTGNFNLNSFTHNCNVIEGYILVYSLSAEFLGVFNCRKNFCKIIVFSDHLSAKGKRPIFLIAPLFKSEALSLFVNGHSYPQPKNDQLDLFFHVKENQSNFKTHKIIYEYEDHGLIKNMTLYIGDSKYERKEYYYNIQDYLKRVNVVKNLASPGNCNLWIQFLDNKNPESLIFTRNSH